MRVWGAKCQISIIPHTYLGTCLWRQLKAAFAVQQILGIWGLPYEINHIFIYDKPLPSMREQGYFYCLARFLIEKFWMFRFFSYLCTRI